MGHSHSVLLIGLFTALLPAAPAQTPKKPDPAVVAYKDWLRQHAPESDEAQSASLFTASADWVRQWPDSQFAWSRHRDALQQTRSHAVEDWKQTGEALIRLSPSHTARVAQDWIAAGVLLEPASGLLQADLARLRNHPVEIALAGHGTLAALVERAGNAAQPLGILASLAEVQIKLKRLDDARATLVSMRRFLDTEYYASIDPDPFDTFPDHEARYLSLAADLALAENRKLDALAFYGRIISNPYFNREYPQGYSVQARALWNELGGSEAAWKLWSQASGAPALAERLPAHLGYLPWTRLNFPLPPLSSTSAAFHGKTTFVLLWSTSCIPCYNELPGVQKLYNQIKTRPDIQVITLSVDKDPAAVSHFLQARNYNFPVIVDAAYIRKILPDPMLGQRWVVDSSGALRLWAANWPMRGQDQAFADLALYKLDRIATLQAEELRTANLR